MAGLWGGNNYQDFALATRLVRRLFRYSQHDILSNSLCNAVCTINTAVASYSQRRALSPISVRKEIGLSPISESPISD